MTSFTVRNVRTGQLMTLQLGGKPRTEFELREHLAKTSPELEFVSGGEQYIPIEPPVVAKIEHRE